MPDAGSSFLILHIPKEEVRNIPHTVMQRKLGMYLRIKNTDLLLTSIKKIAPSTNSVEEFTQYISQNHKEITIKAKYKDLAVDFELEGIEDNTTNVVEV